MGKKKKVLFVSLFGDFVGGGQRSLFLLLKSLDRDKYVPYLVCPGEGAFVDEVRKLGITVFIFTFPSFKLFKIRRFLNIVAKLKQFLAMCNPDIIHTESGRSIIYLKMALWKSRVPFIWHVRVSNPEPILYELLLYYCVDRIIAVSHAVKKRFASLRSSDTKVKVVYNAVDIDAISPSTEQNVFRDEIGAHNSFLVGIIGQVMPLKGHEVFLGAAASVIKKITNARFVIVGEGNKEYENTLKQMVSKHALDEHVSFTGYRADAAEVMGSLEILVNASMKGREWEEGFSRVIIEAMALGKAVIATDVGGNSEAIENGVNGIIVEPGDAAALAQAIIELLSNADKRALLGKAARERVEKCFTLAEQVKAIEHMYEEIRK